jgi:hypothetical protein
MGRISKKESNIMKNLMQKSPILSKRTFEKFNKNPLTTPRQRNQ